MNGRLHGIAHRRIDGSLACDQRLATKGITDDENTKVSATSGGTWMSRMKRALIRHLQVRRLKLLA